ncbi:tetratricopeptide repeat protein [Paraglaciecola sp.]|uniref:tetratricopeptide repeat protein n=1 Tax=Paraglaciecola sp. TaxID=1920173 RepID=UPI00326568EB
MTTIKILFTLLVLSCLSACKEKNPVDCWSSLDSIKSNRMSGNLELAFNQMSELSICLDSSKSEKGMRFYYHLGWLQHDSGDYKKAIESYNKGLEFQSDYAFAFWRRGLAYEQLGDVEQSIADYKNAVQIGKATLPNFSEVLDDYPDVKLNLGPYVQ